MGHEHARAFADVPGVKVTGIYSRTADRATTVASELDIPTVARSIDELWDRARPDLVVVAVHETAMLEVSNACFAHPWTVLLEKPPGLSVREAEAIRGEAERMGRRVLVGLNRRFYSVTRAAVAGLAPAEGRRFIHVQDQQDLERDPRPWQRGFARESWMYANSIHVIDLLRVFGRGDVTDVRAVIPWDPRSPDVVLAAIDFSSGDRGLYEGIWHGPGPWAVSVTMADVRWEMRPLERARVQRRGQRTQEDVPGDDWDTRFKPGLRRQAEHAVAAARGRPNESVSLVDGIETMRLIQRIFSR